ncbi:MAG TPA: O-antigen ligase family protein [Candidatus Bathyarchaeia archaeon]|nr:O-antigen ligase family protein [Candidatus Bathyarchaeia archaeon]
MSTAIQARFDLGEPTWAGRHCSIGTRGLALRLCQGMVLLPLFSLVLLPEYVQGLGDAETKSMVYWATAGPLRMVDVLLLGMIAVHGLVWASSRRLRVSIPRELLLPGLGFLTAIALSMIYGALHGGSNLFFDWRALALGTGLYGVFALWLQSERARDWAIRWFAGYMALRIAMIYVEFVRGGGDVIVGMRIPVFDGPTLSAIVFTGVLGLCMCDAARSRLEALAWMGLSGGAYLLVLLCFRRTFWAELGTATLLLLLAQKHGRSRKLLLAGASFMVVATMLGPAFYERMQSMDFTRDESEFSQGNPDHVGEVMDAWEQVRRAPVVGIGMGRSFPTTRITEWKEESVMVHNAPLHVWLKYGLLGLVCYVWFHAAVLRRLWRSQRASRSGAQRPFLCRPEDGEAETEAFHHSITGFTAAALVYVAAQFAVSLGFAPWPYSSVQSTTLTAFVLAVAMREARP